MTPAPGNQGRTSVTQELLVQDGKKGGQNASNEREEGRHHFSLSGRAGERGYILATACPTKAASSREREMASG